MTVWIALSAAGHPAPIVGWAFTRKALKEQYEKTYGHSLERAGYRAVKATLFAYGSCDEPETRESETTA